MSFERLFPPALVPVLCPMFQVKVSERQAGSRVQAPFPGVRPLPERRSARCA